MTPEEHLEEARRLAAEVATDSLGIKPTGQNATNIAASQMHSLLAIATVAVHDRPRPVEGAAARMPQ